VDVGALPGGEDVSRGGPAALVGLVAVSGGVVALAVGEVREVETGEVAARLERGREPGVEPVQDVRIEGDGGLLAALSPGRGGERLVAASGAVFRVDGAAREDQRIGHEGAPGAAPK